MTHRHLLPNEIDLLVDGDAGFGQGSGEAIPLDDLRLNSRDYY